MLRFFSVLLLSFSIFSQPVLAFYTNQKLFPVGLETYGTFSQNKKYQVPGQININTADINQLLLIPKMTTSTALKIIRLRPFIKPEDLHRLENHGVTNTQVAMLLDVYNNSSRPFIFWESGQPPEVLRQ